VEIALSHANSRLYAIGGIAAFGNLLKTVDTHLIQNMKTQHDYLSMIDTAHSSERFFNAAMHPEHV
jgi:hypothetical protein